MSSAFPFSQNVSDSLSFFRYYQASLDTVNILRIVSFNPYDKINATFKRNVRIIRIIHSAIQPPADSYYSSYILQNSFITDVKIEQSSELPKTFILNQNYPNPFNPVTTISFHVPQKSRVAINIFDILGRLVSSVYDGDISAGGQCYPMEWY